MGKKISAFIIVVSGLLLISYSLIIYFISPSFTYAVGPTQENVLYYVLLRIFIGIVYSIAVLLIINKLPSLIKNITLIFLVGLFTRLILIPSEPILEDDFNRYLWDGAVTANGFNPYEYSPKLFLDNDSISNSAPQTLIKLADKYQGIVEKINFPHIRTIYPPVAQAAFAIAYFVKPFSVPIWKALMLLFDLLVFYLLLQVLKKLKLSLNLIVIYWWNPILLHEIFNAGHMDIIIYPFVLGTILFYLKDRIVVSSALLACAVGVKVWPIIFIPFVLKKAWGNKKVLFTSITIFSAIVFIFLLPILLTKLDYSLGFITYSKNWTNNESIFQLINIVVKIIGELFSSGIKCSSCVTRWIVIIILSGALIYFLTMTEKENYATVKKIFYLIAILFLISPTQFPWYYTWVLPLLVLNPKLSFILYAITLPLYQLNYYWPFLVWIEHIPIILIFIYEAYSSKFSNLLLKVNQ